MEKIKASIDNKNLMEDPFEDEVFGDFYAASDHRKGGRRHLIGHKTVKDMFGHDCEQGIVDVSWSYGDNCVTITLLAVPGTEDWVNTRDYIFDDYKKEFKAWQCEDNPGLVVDFYQLGDKLNVIFYFETE
jgi:hypothetical protein